MTAMRSSMGLASALSRSISVLAMAAALPLAAMAPMNAAVPSPLGSPHSRTAHQPLLAQTNQETLLNFESANYAIRVYRQNNQTFMNVYDRRADQVIVRSQPATFVPNSGPNNAYSSYRAIGNFNAQPATFFARVDAVNNTLLDIFDAQNDLLRRVYGGPNPTVALPAGQRPPSSTVGAQPTENDTRLAFTTASFATRVYQDASILKMNVYTRETNRALQNGAATTVVQNPRPPYDRWVTYVSNGTFQDIPVRYVMRISGRGETLLQIVDANSGSTLLSQPGIGSITVNIPPSDLPPEVDPPTASAALEPFVAAVFGDNNTLSQLQQLRQNAFGGSGSSLLQDPRFENAPQGRFINAGSYMSREQAAALVNYLRSEGFNARLVFRNFRYR